VSDTPGEFTSWPHAVLDGAGVRLLVLLPDPFQGYYRGPRFDWAGTVAWAQARGHTFFGSWRDPPHRPRANDDAAGTAGEFGMGPLTDNPPPIGYNDARPGEAFLKIGVGQLLKVEEPTYSFGALYRILRPAAWGIRTEPGALTFTQEEGPVRGHAFRYQKTVRVSHGDPSFTVEHRLVNTGAHPIEQTHYCHNFMRIDDAPIGRSYSVEFPFRPRFSQHTADVLALQGHTVSFLRDPGPDEGFFALVAGFGTDPADNVAIVHSASTSLRMTGSLPLCRFQIFGTGRTLCPEPFVSLSILPGRAVDWTIRYDFF
jgi:hypothetical protein